MGSFANALFTALLGWTRTVVSALWAFITNDQGSGLLTWIGRNWLFLAAVLCAIGLIADLVIYLARWRPDLVWKSFWRRRNHKDIETEESLQEAPAQPEKPAPIRRRTADDELARWVREPEPSGKGPEAVQGSIVTSAGYIVPEDSPYRRPAEKEKERTEDADTFPTPESSPRVMQTPRRRRKINVNDLFSSPEEELYEFDAPQQLIDRKKAYRDPVYPRGWNQKKEQGE